MHAARPGLAIAMILDQDVLAAIQAGDVPASVSPELLMQKRDQPARIALLFVSILTFVIVVLRFISRWTVKRLGIDDAFAGFSVVCLPPPPPTLYRGKSVETDRVAVL